MIAHKGAFLSVMAQPLISAKTSGRAGFNLPQNTQKTENKNNKILCVLWSVITNCVYD